jgi:ArsR family transcriptional regulator, arsenate/arsenite/antimonite-responsive transcriptional repressor
VDLEQFQRIAKALADPRRFEILEHIAKQSEVGCRRLCGCFPVRQATISHHLKELTSAGLVDSRRDGQFVYYRIRPNALETYMEQLGQKLAVGGRTDVQSAVPGSAQGAVKIDEPAARAIASRRKVTVAKQA